MLPPEPTRKVRSMLPATTFIAASAAKPADASPPTTMTSRPRLFSSAPSALSPTRSTSAAATPSGKGRSDPVTRARRSGMEYMTPSTPPRAVTSAVSQ